LSKKTRGPKSRDTVSLREAFFLMHFSPPELILNSVYPLLKSSHSTCAKICIFGGRRELRTTKNLMEAKQSVAMFIFEPSGRYSNHVKYKQITLKFTFQS
jgi:hypothetical protein